MTNPIIVGEGMRDVSRGHLVIAVNASCSYESIVTLKHLGCIQLRGAKMLDVVDQVEKVVEFGFVEPTRGPTYH